MLEYTLQHLVSLLMKTTERREQAPRSPRVRTYPTRAEYEGGLYVHARMHAYAGVWLELLLQANYLVSNQLVHTSTLAER